MYCLPWHAQGTKCTRSNTSRMSTKQLLSGRITMDCNFSYLPFISWFLPRTSRISSDPFSVLYAQVFTLIPNRFWGNLPWKQICTLFKDEMKDRSQRGKEKRRKENLPGPLISCSLRDYGEMSSWKSIATVLSLPRFTVLLCVSSSRVTFTSCICGVLRFSFHFTSLFWALYHCL